MKEAANKGDLLLARGRAERADYAVNESSTALFVISANTAIERVFSLNMIFPCHCSRHP